MCLRVKYRFHRDVSPRPSSRPSTGSVCGYTSLFLFSELGGGVWCVWCDEVPLTVGCRARVVLHKHRSLQVRHDGHCRGWTFVGFRVFRPT